MAKSVKKAIREEYNRLKKALEKIIKPQKEQTLVLQPVRNKKHLREY